MYVSQGSRLSSLANSSFPAEEVHNSTTVHYVSNITQIMQLVNVCKYCLIRVLIPSVYQDVASVRYVGLPWTDCKVLDNYW